MKRKAIFVAAIILFCVISINAYGACPQADLTGDCKVDLEDFAIMASEWLTTYSEANLAIVASGWLTEGVPEDPANLIWVSIDDPGVDDDGDGIPDHESFVGDMSRYETTNAQYCEFLNAALASGDITVSSNFVFGTNGSNAGEDFVGLAYFETSNRTLNSQISFDGSTFSVRTRDGYSMADHPVVEVSWYGATAFCNYYGYRLPTEWEWQAVADYDGTFTYGCGTTIDLSKVNYYDNGFANPLNLTSQPYTNHVDYYPSYGYGMNDMAGNTYEWTSSISASGNRVFRGGSWNYYDFNCDVSYQSSIFPYYTDGLLGFRVCR